jgi:hypothetical protein
MDAGSPRNVNGGARSLRLCWWAPWSLIEKKERTLVKSMGHGNEARLYLLPLLTGICSMEKFFIDPSTFAVVMDKRIDWHGNDMLRAWLII